MRRLIGSGLLVAVIFGLPVADVLAQKKKKDDPAAVSDVIDSSKLTAGEFVGKLSGTPASDRMFRLEIEVPAPAGNGKAGWNGGNNTASRLAQAQQRMAQAQARLATARTPQQRQQAQQQLLQAQQQLQQAAAQPGRNPGGAGNVKMVKKEIEFQLTEKAKVRTMLLPEAFDDKGNAKKYTKQELAELKGKDKTAVGYESSAEKLEVGQKVRVYLASVAVKAPAKDKEKDEEVMAEKSKQVRMLVILEAGSGEAPTKGKGKAKKK